MRELDGLDARLVPGTDIGNQSGGVGTGNMNPFFSADSQSIGFLSPSRGLVRVGLSGGPLLEIAATPMPAFLGAAGLPTIPLSIRRAARCIACPSAATRHLND